MCVCLSVCVCVCVYIGHYTSEQVSVQGMIPFSVQNGSMAHRPQPYIHRYIRCTYGIFSRETTIHTVIYGADTRFWPTLPTTHRPQGHAPSLAKTAAWPTTHRQHGPLRTGSMAYYTQAAWPTTHRQHGLLHTGSMVYYAQAAWPTTHRQHGLLRTGSMVYYAQGALPTTHRQHGLLRTGHKDTHLLKLALQRCHPHCRSLAGVVQLGTHIGVAHLVQMAYVPLCEQHLLRQQT